MRHETGAVTRTWKSFQVLASLNTRSRRKDRRADSPEEAPDPTHCSTTISTMDRPTTTQSNTLNLELKYNLGTEEGG
jgi:hypothetical protein